MEVKDYIYAFFIAFLVFMNYNMFVQIEGLQQEADTIKFAANANKVSLDVTDLELKYIVVHLSKEIDKLRGDPPPVGPLPFTPNTKDLLDL